MKVLLLTTHLNTGGIAVYTVNLARHLRKSGLDAIVVSAGGDLEEKLKESGITHISLDIKTKFEFGFKIWKALPRLTALIKEEGIDLVHAQTRVTQVLGCLAGRRTGIPLVTTCHGFFKHDRLGRIVFPCWGGQTIAISNSVREHLLGDFKVPEEQISMIHNGIELEHYSRSAPGTASAGTELKKRIGINENTLVIGSVGRLSSVKGYKYLIEAFGLALKEYDQMQLIIVGEGNERDALEGLTRRLALLDKVRFISGKEASLKEFFSMMDIFCLPSVSEGLGLSLMEAMATGRACAASDVGGISELITQGEDGILVPSRDAEALCDAIIRLAKDEELRRRFGEKAREKAVRHFSMEDSAAKTVEVYRKALKG